MLTLSQEAGLQFSNPGKTESITEISRVIVFNGFLLLYL